MVISVIGRLNYNTALHKNQVADRKWKPFSRENAPLVSSSFVFVRLCPIYLAVLILPFNYSVVCNLSTKTVAVRLRGLLRVENLLLDNPREMRYNIGTNKLRSDDMELKNTRTIYSSENCEIVLGEFEGKRFIKKTGKFSHSTATKIMEINSPYIPKIVEIGDDYIVTEYADGEDLASAKIPAKKVYDVALEMCSALESLHNENVIHRDIKPSNIILCDNRHIKLTDFDAACVKKTVTEKDTFFVGTDGFAPPEQYGFKQTDERSDIYALGVTIKLLLGESFNRAHYRRVIEKCMRFDPEQRYSSVKKLRNALLRHKPLPTACAVGTGVALVGMLIIDLTVMYTPDPPKAVDNFQVEESVPTVESTTESSSALESAAVSSSTVKSATESTSVPNSYSIVESTPNNIIVPNSSSSTKSSTQSSSVSNSVPITESVPQSSAVSVSSTSTESTPESVPEPPFPYENERSYTIDWDMLTLPEGFPRLRDKVSFYDFNAVNDNGLNHAGRYSIFWNVMPESEIEGIIQKLYDWLGTDSDFEYIPSDRPERKEWVLNNDDFIAHISWGGDGPATTWLFVTPTAADYDFPKPTFDTADPTVTPNSYRSLKWEDSILNGTFTKLTDGITYMNRIDGNYSVFWDRMRFEELEAVMQKIMNSFDEECEFSMIFRNNMYIWNFSGNFNGEHKNVEICYAVVPDAYFGNDCQLHITYK